MATPSLTSPKPNDRLAELWADLLADPVPPKPVTTPQKSVTATVLLKQNETMRSNWKVDLKTLFQSLLEPEVLEPPMPCTGEETFEGEAFSEPALDAAHEVSLSVTSPFHWEPKPAWITRPDHFTPAFVNPADPQRFTPRPKIPLRPLHKQPFYSRFFFYLRHWLNRSR
jgi:hypothetical protein